MKLKPLKLHGERALISRQFSSRSLRDRRRFQSDRVDQDPFESAEFVIDTHPLLRIASVGRSQILAFKFAWLCTLALDLCLQAE